MVCKKVKKVSKLPNSQDSVRNKDQRETAGGIIGSLQKFIAFAGEYPKRSLLGVAILFTMIPIILALIMPERTFDLIDRILERNIKQSIIKQQELADAKIVDRFIAQRLIALRLQSNASRAVARAFVFERDDSNRIIGIVDVFETMDAKTEMSGARERDLDLESVINSVNFMLSEIDPKCIARNTEDFDDNDLKVFLMSANLNSSVACPMRRIDGEPLGIIAVSSISRIEDNVGMITRTRDAALELSGYMSRSPATQLQMEKFRKSRESRGL